MPRDELVAYMTDWANSFSAPVQSGVDVVRVRKQQNVFRLSTSKGEMAARCLVVATATYQCPKTPAIAASISPEIRQLHAEGYKNPGQADEGAVLVVGSGQTGCQVTEDFLRAGRKVHLCVSRTGRLPRRYRGRDCLEWQADMGLLDRTPDMLPRSGDRFLGDPHVTGRDGGATVNLHDFRDRGTNLLGRLKDIEGKRLRFSDDLQTNLKFADDFAEDFLRRIDRHIAENRISCPPPAVSDPANNSCPPTRQTSAPALLDLEEAGIATIIWATGFGFDFSWIEGVPTDAFGYPVTSAGASPMEGLFFCGLNWMTKRKSGILYGVEEDARSVAAGLARQLGSPRRHVA